MSGCAVCPDLCLLSFGLNTVLLGRDCWFILKDDYLGHWGLMTQYLSNCCGFREGDSVVSKLGTKNNLFKAVGIPSPGTVLVLRLAQFKGGLRHVGSRSRTIKAQP